MRFVVPINVAAAATFSRAAQPTDFLPAAAPWRGASESLIAHPENPWITPSEKTDLTDSPDYATTIEYLEKLCAASALLRLQPFGQTSQGRTLYVVIGTKEKTFTPEALRASGKPTLLAQAGIHSGEIEGKDAGLMLLRDIAFGGKSELLDGANLLFIPVLNADGHERSSKWNRPNQRGPIHQGWRTTAQNLNLNRDYVKAASPEMRALLALLNAWQPSLYLDIHATDGIDYEYDITYSYHGADGSTAWSAKIGRWLDTAFHPTIARALEQAGHFPLNVYVDPRDARDLTQGLLSGHAGPRFSHGYGDLRHIPSVLIETHSLKSYRQRVLGTCVLLTASLELLGRDAQALHAAIATDRATRPESVPVNWVQSEDKHAIDFRGIEYESYKSVASGGDEIRWTGRPKLYPKLPVFGDRPAVQLKRPRAYWVPASKSEVIERLKLHGMAGDTLTTAKTITAEFYRLVEPQPMGSGQPFEGRHLYRANVQPEVREEIFPMGSLRVPTDQPLGDLAMAMLEPACEDSLFAWGFFAEILQLTEYIEGYVIAPLADRMLANDPKLEAEFGAKLAADSKFAADPMARLRWFYARSPFYDARYLLYPVGIER